jgi:hypothetical protein
MILTMCHKLDLLHTWTKLFSEDLDLETFPALPPYKDTKNNLHFQIKRVTMCPIHPICHIIKEFELLLQFVQ